MFISFRFTLIVSFFIPFIAVAQVIEKHSMEPSNQTIDIEDNSFIEVDTLVASKMKESQVILQNKSVNTSEDKKSVNTVYRIYPNPAGSKLTIELVQNSRGNSDIDIYDSNLSLYESYHVEESQSNLTVSSEDWQDGIYFVIITQHSTQQTILQKVIINHRVEYQE